MSSISETDGPAKDPSHSLVGAALFLVGLVSAVILSLVVSWPDQEAFNFDRTLVQSEALPALHCPLIITPKDSGRIDVSIRNAHIRATTLRIRSRISEGSISLFREEIQQIALEPGEKQVLSWPIFVEDAVYNRIVMARVNQFKRTPFPAMASSCGVLVLDVPWLTGVQTTAVLVVVTALFLGLGTLIWLRSNRPLRGRRQGAARRGGIMLALVLLSIITGLLKMPAIGLMLLLLATFFVFSLLERLN